MTRRYLTALAIAAGVLTIDLLTKRWASVAFASEPLDLIPGFLSLTYVENPGAAFSLLPNGGSVIGVVAIIVVIGLLWSLRIERSRFDVVIFGLIIGAALGNLADRVFRGDGFLDGKVIDWIDLWWIPTFNVADMSLTFAVVILLIHAWASD